MSENVSDAFMLRAISLGEKGRLTAPPNPWVGCVITKNGVVVGEAYHHAAGMPHAETEALKIAGEKAIGSTVYLTLEPCSHYGRTPPCVDALIAAQVARVIIALRDPDPKVNGKGIAKLTEAGIAVEEGLCAHEAGRSLESYLHQRRTGRPYCIAKAAISVDGRTSAADGSSQWITSPEARADAHAIRAESQAILIGTGTALKDLPRLDVRNHQPLPEKQPLRVLLDATGRVMPPSPLFDTQIAPTLVFTSSSCNPETLKLWKECGAEVEIIPTKGSPNRLDLSKALEALGNRGILQLLVEGGSNILSSFLNEKAIDRLVLYIGPRILGDKGAPLFKDIVGSNINEAPFLELVSSRRLNDCVRVDYVTK